MRKFLATAIASLFLLPSMGQTDEKDNRLANIDWKEDSVEITTIKDIVRTQQMVTNRSAQAGHYAKVWANRCYFNLAYHTKSTLNPTEDYETVLGLTGYNKGIVPMFSRKYGLSLMAGKNIKLHKPIAQMVQFNIDFTGMDLSFDYYEAENEGKYIYDSDETYMAKDDNNKTKEFYYPHWNSKKFRITYGMNLGPSITVAPFTHLNGARGLHFLKFNVYYHIGYRASFMLFNPQKEEDVLYDLLETLDLSALEARNHIQFMIGHGLYHGIGFGMSWKRIGFGYEHTFGKLKYKNIGDDDYEKVWYKFKTTTNRVYLTYRF